MNENNHNIETRTKICSGCGEEKSLDEFHYSKCGKYNRRQKCKVCRSIEAKEKWKIKNFGKPRKPRKKKIKVRPDIKEKECRICHEIKSIENFEFRKYRLSYRNECLDCVREIKKEYGKKNRAKLSQHEREFYKDPEKKRQKRNKQNEREKQRRLEDPSYRMRLNLKTCIRAAFKLYSKNGKTMSCKQYGIDFEAIYNKVGPCPGSGKDWHLDHIIPISIFNLDNPEHVILSHLPENLRWLESKINTSKSDDIIDLVYENPVLVNILKIIGKYEEHRDINK